MLNKNINKIIFIILLFPIGFLLMFAFGEILAGDFSGFGHFIQLAPIFLIGYLSIKKPFVSGMLLFLVGLFLGITYPSRASFQIQTILLVESLLFMPLVTAGILLMRSAKRK